MQCPQSVREPSAQVYYPKIFGTAVVAYFRKVSGMRIFSAVEAWTMALR